LFWLNQTKKQNKHLVVMSTVTQREPLGELTNADSLNTSNVFTSFMHAKKRGREAEMDSSINERNTRPRLEKKVANLFEYTVDLGTSQEMTVSIGATPQKESKIPTFTQSQTRITPKGNSSLNSSTLSTTRKNVTGAKPSGLNNSTISTPRGVSPRGTASARLNTSQVKPAPTKTMPKPATRSTSRLNNSTLNNSIVGKTATKPAVKGAVNKFDTKGLLEEEKKKSGALQSENVRLNEEHEELVHRCEDMESQLGHFGVIQQEGEKAKRELYALQATNSELHRLSRQQDIELETLRRIQKTLESENLEFKMTSKHLESQMSTQDTHHRLELSTLKAQQESAIRLQRQEYELKEQELRDIQQRDLNHAREMSQREISKIRNELERTQIDLNYAIEESNTRLQKINEMSKLIEKQTEEIKSLETKRNMDEESRRKLHNMIQELKGNIRVYCRVRPLGSNPADTIVQDGEEPEFKAVSFIENDPDQRSIEILGAPTTNATSTGLNEGKKYLFQFDKVFRPDARQKDVFVEISQLVQSALDGYKVCIFAYGQTGSGKTYTMEGPPKNRIKSMSLEEEEESKGMIPRSVEQIFETMRAMSKQGWKYTLEASYLEIYNETVRDLLCKIPSTNPDADAIKYEIKHDPLGNTSVTNLTYLQVDRPEKVHELLSIASKNRAAAATTCNERSSRSHAVFTLRISGHNEATDQTTNGVLNLVDLAGSERLTNSNATGTRLDETRHINKSLSCLGDVIAALAVKSSKKNHIPYRNSKLTYLLQNCLGGDSKTLMFVNISPKSANVNETICSLRFASKVNSCEIGTASRKVK
jgi:kinesin family protein C1